ncbi:LysR family transcriptional regulator [Moraxella caviae]|uniref:D-malate degradation protein R n=1 Tax=Moraxella caviae TaxID=34060 RepID=A0A1T0A2Q7_9GAMM|nr:LysR family transcriptional regulator [Moraxella caviae]OOR90082.1 LysR family transcriptional regulator [Moraxella caviae]STZ14698.1 D-malate degradation protein R [Moraxella caviae]VEW12874.1 D-malate degradation protein R [Moraxella caviae]
MLENLRGMAVFASVVKQGSFSGAAKELGITTSAVSQQIRSLESDLGVALLHRSTRKLSLSEAGESLYNEALEIVKAAERGRDSVSQLKDEVSGSLRVATSPNLAKTYLLPALASWIAEHENLSLNVISRGDSLDLIEDRIDVALILDEEPQPNGIELTKVKQVWLAAPSYLKVHGAITSPKDLADQTIIICGDKHNESLEFKKGDEKQHSMRVQSRLMSNDPDIALALAVAGHGVVKANELDAKELVQAGKLVPVLTDYELNPLVLSVVTATKEQLPVKAQKCIEVLREYFKV